MQLITFLLITVAVLTLLTGVVVLFGTTKQSRNQGAWFFVATVGAAVWSIVMAIWMQLSEESASFVPWLNVGIIGGITLTDVAMVGYTSWQDGTKGKAITMLFCLLGLALVGLIVVDPHLFYTKIEFGSEYNRLEVAHGWYFYVMIAFFVIISLVYSGALTKAIKNTRSKGAKNGLRILQAGLTIGGILALVFDLILITDRPDLVWIGPMAVSTTIITFYYSVVKYKILSVSGSWMVVLSYAILIAMGIVAYMVIFYAMFMVIFRTANPSASILLLNMIMVIIILCLIPAISEIASIIKSLLPIKQMDIGYITKKLDRLSRDKVDIRELASFLALTLKFENVGFLINGRIYESQSMGMSSNDLVAIAKLEVPKDGIWQDFKGSIDGDEKIDRIALLTDRKGRVFGQIIYGKQATRRSLERKDLVQMEMVIDLAGMIVDENTRIKTS